MDTATPEYYTAVRICAYCKRYFTEGEQLGRWACVRHLRPSAQFHANVPPAHPCCTSTGPAIANGLGQLTAGCVRHDHEDAVMKEPHAVAVLAHNVNLQVLPKILFSRLGVAYPAAQSIVAQVSAAAMREWLEGHDLARARLRIKVAMGETTLDLLAMGRDIARKTLAGPYGTLARFEDSDARISELEGEAYVRATGEFRPWLPDTDEGGAVVTLDDYFAEERHRMEQEDGTVEAISFVVFSREAFQRLPVAETQMRQNLAAWNCLSLADWHRQYSLQLSEVLYTDKLEVK